MSKATRQAMLPPGQYRRTAAWINLSHLENNLRELKKLIAPGTFFCPMVKANAYGHGDVAISLKLEQLGVKTLGVGLIEEGLLLRRAGCRSQILFFGIFDEHGVEPLLQAHLTPVLSTWEQILCLEKKVKSPTAVHVKFDTGMHRLGFSMRDLEKLQTHFEKSLLKVEGVLTHLHSAEGLNPREGSALEQLRRFAKVEKAFAKTKPVAHSLNSAGLINFAKYQASEWPEGLSPHQGVRPGLAIYGISPVVGAGDIETSSLPLKPVMSLRSEIVRTHRLQVGESVSYGAHWTAKRESLVGVVPMGYADGYHRLLSNRGQVLFRGQTVPVIGNVCMDYIMIDVTDVVKNETAESLDHEPVTLFGEDEQGNALSAEKLATAAQTISWEILTSVGERVPRVIENEGGL
jgi:alanine racemase